MPAFDISTADHEIEIAHGATKQVVFTVANQIGERVFARADLEPDDPSVAGWLSVEGKRERSFDEKAEDQYVVRIAPGKDAPAGKYLFRLRMVRTDKSASEFAHASEPIAFTVKPPPGPIVVKDPEDEEVKPPKRNWWLFVAIGLFILVLMLSAAVLYLLVFPPTPTPGPTPEATAELTAEPTQPTGVLTGTIPDDTVEFGSVVLGEQTSETITIQADGSVQVELSIGEEGTAFSTEPNCVSWEKTRSGLLLCEVDLTFAPLEPGEQTATLRIEQPETEPVIILLRGFAETPG